MRFTRSINLVVVLTLVSGGCSGTSSSTQQYFADLATISTALSTELDDVEGAINAGLLDINFEAAGAEAQFIELFRTSILNVEASFQRLVTALQNLQPTGDLVGPHEQAVAAGLQVLADYQSEAGRLDAMASLADIDAYAETLSTADARRRFAESCLELQGIATNDDIDLDLNC